jgi:glycosyltransferase involved in cell wall biosynthesis
MADALQRTLRGAQFDAVVVEQLAMAQYRALIKDVPVVLFPVDAVSRLKWQFVVAERNPLKKVAYFADYRLTLAYEHQAYRASDGVLFVSNVDAEYAIANGQVNASRLFVISIGIDLGHFHPEPGANQAATMVFVGNLENRVNEHAVLWFHHNVWPELRKTIPEAVFLVVGQRPGETIRRLAQHDDRIVVTGFVSDFRPYVWQSKLFVAPLQLGTGIKTRVLQAMAMGKAIVASPSSAEGIAVQDGKHLILARTPKEYLEHICALWIDPTRRAELGREARLLVEARHSREAAASKFLDSLHATLSRVR